MSMRMMFWTFILWTLTIAGSPCPAEAQGTVYGSALGFSLKGGYLFPSDTYQDGHLGVGGAFLVRFSSNFTLEVEGAFSQIPVRSQADGLSQGRLLHIPATVSLRFRLPLRNIPLAPYLIAGGGFALNIFALDKEMVQGYQDLGFELEETCASALLAQLGGGLEISLSPNISLDLQARYRFSRTSSEWSITDEVTRLKATGTVERVNLSAVQVLGGLRFLFN